MRKPYWAWFLKACAAGCIALLLLTGIGFFYYNYPMDYPNESGATDSVWAPNVRYNQMKEGFSWGRTNNEGFMRSKDYSEGMDIDVLIMGSSQMESSEVPPGKSTAELLEARLADESVYNIGVSGHVILTCLSNFDAAMSRYQPKKYVIVETDRTAFTREELLSVLDGTLPEIPVGTSGIRGLLSRNMFLRQVYIQFVRATEEKEEPLPGQDAVEAANSKEFLATLDALLKKISQTAAQYGTEVIIFYHPLTELGSDGGLLFPDEDECVKIFSECCAQNGIHFLDLTERIRTEYETNHVLPYGFVNTSVGEGHMNARGHEMLADELYKLIA